MVQLKEEAVNSLNYALIILYCVPENLVAGVKLYFPDGCGLKICTEGF